MSNQKLYLSLRSQGVSASEAYRQCVQSNVDRDKRTLEEWVANIAAAVVVGAVVVRVLGDLLALEAAKVWVVSPSRNTYRELPIKVAMRVIRKRPGWRIAETVPVSLLRRSERVGLFRRIKRVLSQGSRRLK